MKAYYYYQIIRKTLIQMLDLFNDVKVARYNSDGTIRKYVTVPLKLGGKQKVWYWIHERKDDQMLPIMSMTVTGMNFATERQVNKLHKILKEVDPEVGLMSRFINPVPYDINTSLSIWTLWMADADQILEQILPYFNPYVIMKVYVPEADATLDVKVVFNSCTPDFEFEMADDTLRVIRWNLDFTIQSYIFQPISSIIGEDGGDGTGDNIIKKIISKIYTNEDVWNDYRGLYIDGSTETVFTSGASGAEAEALYIKAISNVYDPDVEILYSYEIFD
jgi:hypothetical protein